MCDVAMIVKKKELDVLKNPKLFFTFYIMNFNKRTYNQIL